MPRAAKRPLDYVAVARIEHVVPGRATVVRAAGRAIALYRVDGRILALDDACLRCGSSLGSGSQRGACATCGRCGWTYDIASGSVEGVPALRIDRYDVRIAGADATVAVPPMEIPEDG